MIAVVASIQTIADYTVPDTGNKAYIIYTPFHPTQEDRFVIQGLELQGLIGNLFFSAGTKLWQSLANSLIMISVIAVMTFFLVMLYKYR